MRHLENMGKVMLATGLIVGYGYVIEAFIGWYSANTYEAVHDLEPHDRAVRAGLLGADPVQHRHAAVPVVQAACGTSPILLFAIAMVVNVGMWLERFVIVVTSLHRDFLPSSWGMYCPTRWDWMTFFGTIGLFLTLFFLFIRVAADDLDLRDADDRARGEDQGREGALIQ